jgi:hypothetical protein
MYVGGRFTMITKSGVADYNRQRIARLSNGGTGIIDNTFNPIGIFTDPSTTITAIEQMSGYQGVIVSSFEGQINKALVKLSYSTDTGNPAAYDSFHSITGNNIIRSSAIKIDNSNKLLACLLTSNASISSVRLYRFNVAGFAGIDPITLDTTFGGGDAYVNIQGDITTDIKYVYSISVDSENNIILGGDFTKIDGINRQFFAVLNNSGALLNR